MRRICLVSLLFTVSFAGPVRGAVDFGGELAPSSPPASPPPMPSLLSPGRAADIVYAGGEARWEGPRHGAGFETVVEAPVAAGLSLRAGAVSNVADRRVTPSFVLKLDLLRQGGHGVAGALFAGYRGEGFNMVPAMELGIALGRTSSQLSLISSLAYGQGLERGERYGDVRLAGLLRVHRALSVGLDARARFDLEIDDDEPAGEAAVDGVAGPIVVWSLGPVSVSGQVGFGLVAPRAGGGTQMGPTTRLGVGAAF